MSKLFTGYNFRIFPRAAKPNGCYSANLHSKMKPNVSPRTPQSCSSPPLIPKPTSQRFHATLISFCSAGICVRCDTSSVYMHHKFVLVDGRRLITGSLNWTTTAVQSNLENVIVTQERDLVQPFVVEFQRLWVANDPERRCCTSR